MYISAFKTAVHPVVRGAEYGCQEVGGREDLLLELAYFLEDFDGIFRRKI